MNLSNKSIFYWTGSVQAILAYISPDSIINDVTNHPLRLSAINHIYVL